MLRTNECLRSESARRLEEIKLLELHSEGSSQRWLGAGVSSGHRSAQPSSGALCFPLQSSFMEILAFMLQQET